MKMNKKTSTYIQRVFLLVSVLIIAYWTLVVGFITFSLDYKALLPPYIYYDMYDVLYGEGHTASQFNISYIVLNLLIGLLIAAGLFLFYLLIERYKRKIGTNRSNIIICILFIFCWVDFIVIKIARIL